MRSRRRYSRLFLPKHRLKRLDVISLIGIILLALYLGFVDEEEPLLIFADETRTISGWAEVTDGDSLKIKGERIRLVGIDAPEMAQYCLDKAKNRQPCGILAKQHLQSLIQNRSVTCRWQERDRYDRILGICQAGNDDLNRLMVENGWAFSYYTSVYNHEQKLARSQKKGMWGWQVQQPQKWRQENLRH